MDKQCEKKLKTMQKGDLFDLKQIVQIVEDLLISFKRKPYIEDFLKMEYFDEFKPLKVRRIFGMLDKDFGVISYHPREVDTAVHVQLKTIDSTEDFYAFKKMVDKVYDGQDFIKKITIVNPENNQFKVIINQDYSDVLLANKNTLYWRLLLTLALKGVATKQEFRNAYDQLNSPEKTPFKKKYKYSKILKSKNNEITCNIELEVITESDYRERKIKFGI